MNPSSIPPPQHHQHIRLFPPAPQHPNPTFYLQPSQPPPRPPPPPIPPSNPPTTAAISSAPPTLSTALSSLSHLLSVSHHTLTSLTHSISPNSPSDYVPCPYNPHHLMPPHSLFLHSLRCPTPVFENPSSLLDSLHYPSTVNPRENPIFSNPPLQDSQSTELHLSLDSFYHEFSSNFFYKDCPGVVNIRDLDGSKRSFTLPRLLSAECVDSDNDSQGQDKGIQNNEFKVLPSGLWGIKREVDSWVDYPSVYSYSVLCAILRLNLIKGSDLRRWIITHSPRYGVVIDVYVRDHLNVLFRLCLKAIRSEALSFVDCEMNGKKMSFRCPVLVQSLMWIISQLSVLYGEVNAKAFAIHVLKQCVLDMVDRSLLFSLESHLEESLSGLDAEGKNVEDVELKEPMEGSAGCNTGKEEVESVNADAIFVSQVVAAVASLHERSLLELKIKALRFPLSLPRYQRTNEHTFVSMRAHEERKQRANYRAIIEHDGALRKQSSNQESGKTKTREELLAEERDYKRRRMSYRGKKSKRSTIEVMRDIIDEYMEDIKQASGIGLIEKGAEEEGVSSKPSSADVVADFDEPRRSNSYYSEATTDTQKHYLKTSHFDDSIKSTPLKDTSTEVFSQEGRGYHGHHKRPEYQRKSGNLERLGREYYPESPERHRRSHGRSYEQGNHQREPDDIEQTRSRNDDKRYSSKSKYHDYKSHSANKYNVPKNDQKLDRDGHQRSSYQKYGSKVLEQNSFEDRYDPTESHDNTYEGDSYTRSKYTRPEEF